MQSSSFRLSRRRRRTVLSCQECHRRKVRCDRKAPCIRCITSKVHCAYDTSRTTSGLLPRSKPSPVSVKHGDVSPQHSVSCGNTLQPPLPVGLHSAASLGPPFENDDRMVVSVSQRNTPERLAQGPIEPGEPKDCIQDPSHIDADTITHTSHSKRSFTIPPSSGQVIINKNRVFGQSHWMNITPDFQFLRRSLTISTARTSGDEELNSARKDAITLLTKCKILARELKQDRPGRTCNSSLHSHFQHFSRDIADRAISAYISCFESVFRILHLPTLRDECERYWADMSNQRETMHLKIQLCLAIGSSLLGDCSDTLSTKRVARATISAAQHWLSAPFEKDRLSIEGLQIQCLLLVARQIFTVGGDLIWVSAGTLLHSAIQMGLNRDPEQFPSLFCVQVQTRRRLWATILELSLQASLDAGTFPLIQMEDFDTIAPANVNDKDLKESIDMALTERIGVPTDASLQRVLLESFPLRLQILRCMNNPKPKMSHETAILIATKLEAYCRDLRSAIHLQDEMYQFKHNMADFLLRRFILSLHHPFANQARERPQYHYSRKICLDAAMMILSPPESEEYSRLVLLGGGMFKIRLRYLSLALGSELISDIHENGSLHTAYRVMLLQALKQARSDALARTELGDTCARLNLTLSMIITRAELANAEEDFELNMVRSAKTALEQSLDILRRQVKPPAKSAEEELTTSLLLEPLPEFDIDLGEFLQLGNWNSGVAMGDWSGLL